MELYGRGAVVDMANARARSLNIEGLDALDLRTLKPDGSAWDFTKRADRRLALQLVKERKPRWLIVSPPCTAFSTWNQGLNAMRMNPALRRKSLREGRLHLRFVAAMCQLQLDHQRHFLFEHPQGAASWKEECIQQLLRHPDVDSVTSHQCEYGLYSRAPDGRWLRCKKPTRWMSSSMHVLQRLSKRCRGDHAHQYME